MKKILTILGFLMIGGSMYAQYQPIKKEIKQEVSPVSDTKKETNSSSSTAEANKDNPVLEKKVYHGSSSGQGQRPIIKVIVPEKKDSTDTPK
jgi:hypothetical protein